MAPPPGARGYRITATIRVGPHPEGVAITPDGTHAYVTNDGPHNVSVIIRQ